MSGKNINDAEMNAAIKEALGLNEEGDPTDYFYTKAQVEELLLNVENPVMGMMRQIGISDVISIPIGASSLFAAEDIMVDGNSITCLYRIAKEVTMTGFKVPINVQGVYVADGYNGIKIFSVSGTVGTEIGATVDDGALWAAPSTSIIVKNLPAPIVLTPGLYMVSSVWNASTTTTAPRLLHMGGSSYFQNLTPSHMKLVESRTSQASIPSSIDFNNSGSALNKVIRGIWIY